MRLFTFDQWATLGSVATEPGDFVGIAIGPESDESTVRVNGALLQAGRVLPMRASSYTIARERIDYINPFANGILGSIARLQVMAFECPSELAVDVARPNGVYSAQASIPNGGVATTLVTVPFRGRRQAFFDIVGPADGTELTYSVIAYRWMRALGALRQKTLKTDTVLLDADLSYAFYIGGDDNAENWDALRVMITNNSAGAITWAVDVETIGEIGR